MASFDSSRWLDRLRARIPQLRRVRVKNIENTALILCGERRVNPTTVAVLSQLFPGRAWNFISAGLYGKHCRANFRNARWIDRCFAQNVQFPVVYEEYCDNTLVDVWKQFVAHLVAPGGYVIVPTRTPRQRPFAIPGLAFFQTFVCTKFPLTRYPVFVYQKKSL